MVVPRSSLTGRRRGAGCYSLSEPPGPKFKDNFGLSVRKLYRLTRPCLSSPAATPVQAPWLPPHGLDGTPQFRLKPMYSTPPSNEPMLVRSMARFVNSRTLTPSPFWLVFALPKASGIRDKKTRIRCLDRLAECSFWNPSGSDRRDPNTLAPNRIKARTTPSRPSRISTSS